MFTSENSATPKKTETDSGTPREVTRLAESGNVVFLCYEEEQMNCHRSVLLEIISEQY